MGKIAMVENTGVEKAGVDSRGGKCRSKSYGTPTRDYIEKTSHDVHINLSAQVRIDHTRTPRPGEGSWGKRAPSRGERALYASERSYI